MALPPERISIKRRRQEDPVEALYLQENASRDQKRRFTEYYFKLLRNKATDPLPSKRVISDTPQSSSNHASNVDASGIPLVRATAPGDEISDFKKLRAAQEARRVEYKPEDDVTTRMPAEAEVAAHNHSPSASKTLTPRPRRFHLARALSSFHRPDPSGGIRKATGKLRPPLATFVERQSAILSRGDGHVKPPIDKILNGAPAKLEAAEETKIPINKSSQENDEPSATAVDTFVKTVSPSKKLGTSINDHPSTWDLESDQLADELAALAMELEPGSLPFRVPESAPAAPTEVSHKADVDMVDDDFVYETYIRMSHVGQETDLSAVGNLYPSFGVLIIDEEDEELWEQYMEGEDDDSEWDEEDSNAEDNPANDYPEDEVSSEDEFGRGAYNHRQYASDDEEYGDESDDD